MGANKNNQKGIRRWKGLLHDSPRSLKLRVFFFLLILSVSMTFMQFGFIGMGPNTEYLCYVFGLLAPIAATAVLLGKGASTLQGFLSGAVLYVHARLQPLDLMERYFVSVLNSFVLYTFAGFLIGLFFAVALHNRPRGKSRVVYVFVASFLASFLTSLAFLLNIVVDLFILIARNKIQSIDLLTEWSNAFVAMGSIDAQLILDMLLMAGVVLLCCFVVERHERMSGSVRVQAVFRTDLFVAVALTFMVAQATIFAAITHGANQASRRHMTDELGFLDTQLSARVEHFSDLEKMTKSYDISEEDLYTVMRSASIDGILDGYSLDDGTVVVFYDGMVMFSDSPSYPAGVDASELFDGIGAEAIENLAKTGGTREMVYTTQPFNDNNDGRLGTFTSAELGYMQAVKAGDYYIMMAMPASMIYASRQTTMMWASLLATILLAVVYVVASKLLGRLVIEPINRTNASLARITAGNLDEAVTETSNVEFASLSDGINTTVGALKGWINEAETRMERELATAKAIQESAIPRVFPPFPEVDAFDIFASMDAAKEVGGDFFDFFLIDDCTLGFLIADVSGKGVPGALFMMAAKTEIENYLSTGMDPAQAIASANMRLCANNDAGMFVTVWAATLNWKTGLLTYVNAGHNPPLLRHGNGGEWEWLKKKCGLFLGTFDTAKYRQETIELQPGDELLLYTDGVNEAFNSQEQEYGNDRLASFLANHDDIHPRELVRSLRADVAHWAQGAVQSDDVTILSLEYGVAPEVTGTITVPATLDRLDEVISFVSGELERRLCPINVQRKVEVALEELFVNVCNYAYANQEEPGTAQVRYAYGADPSTITVELRDQGVPFDPLKRKDPTKPASIQEAKIGGLGIFMVRKSMDDVAYMRDGNTNVLVFKKGW